MSFDIFVQDLPAEAADIGDIPDDFEPLPLGTRADIIARILEVIPEADFSDPAWGHIDDDLLSIEVNLGADQVCSGFAFHVRGGDEAIGVVAAILDHLGLRAINPQAGAFFEAGPNASASFARWRAYRDRVVG